MENAHSLSLSDAHQRVTPSQVGTSDQLRECSFSYSNGTPVHGNVRGVLGHDDVALEAARCIADVVRTATPKAEYGQDPHALIVGGFVRDAVIGVSSKDLDMEVFGLSDQELEVRLNRAFPGKVVRAGRSYSGLQVRFERELVVDVTVPRSMTDNEVIDPSLKFSDAARRRDFTMNALGANPFTGQIYDPFGGIRDLKSGELQHVHATSFRTDPIRVYRAAQFCARFELDLSSASLQLMCGMVTGGELDNLPASRITEEFDKLFLKADEPSRGLEVLSQVGLVQRHWPELLMGTGGPSGSWRELCDRMDCAASLREGLAKDEARELMLASLLMARVPCGSSGADGAVQENSDTGRKLLDRLEINTGSSANVCRYLEQQWKTDELFSKLESGSLSEKEYVNGVRMVLRSVGSRNMDLFLKFCEVAYRSDGSSVSGVYSAGLCFAEMVYRHGLKESAATQLVSGRDILARGGQAGPIFSRIITRIEDLRDKGVIDSREEALMLLDQWSSTDWTEC
jgi:tRNA nucleotidyltransferase (CCA-adding enzyme)